MNDDIHLDFETGMAARIDQRSGFEIPSSDL
jgi:hypothetical protein